MPMTKDYYKKENTILTLKKKKYLKRQLIAGALLANVSFGLGASAGYLVYNDPVKPKSIKYYDFVDFISNSTTLYNKDDITLAFEYNYISVERVHEAIDNNINLPTRFKNIAHYLVQKVYINYPNFDFRCFYENIQSVSVETLSVESLREQFGIGVAAVYQIHKNIIYVTPNTGEVEICHELSHLFKSYFIDENNEIIKTYCYLGVSLNEAMNCEINSLVKNDYSYTKERAIIRYFQNYVDFDIQDYSDNSIYYLLSLLIEKYPKINIEELFDLLDKDHENESLNGTPNYINDRELDYLFDICLLNIDTNNIYESFINFIQLFNYVQNEEIVFDYLERYNNELLKLDVNDIISVSDIKEKISPFNTIIGLLYNDNEAYPVTNYFNYEYTILKEDIEEKIPGYGYTYLTFNTYDILSLFLSSNKDDMSIIDYMNSKNPDYKEYNFYYNNELLSTNKMDNIEIKIVLNDDNSIGYILRDNYNNYSYIYNYNTSNIITSSNFITLKDYIGPHINEDVNLNNFLNETYLKYLVNYDKSLFGNIEVEEDNIIVKPNYILTIVREDSSIISSDNLYDYIISSNGEKLSFFNKNINIQYPCDFDGVFNMEDVFNYYNLLGDDESLVYKDIEISSLIIDFINENYLKEEGYSRTYHK